MTIIMHPSTPFNARHRTIAVPDEAMGNIIFLLEVIVAYVDSVRSGFDPPALTLTEVADQAVPLLQHLRHLCDPEEWQ